MKSIILAGIIFVICVIQIKAQGTGSEFNNSYSKICESQESALKPLGFDRDAGPIHIAVTDDDVLQAVFNDKIFFSESLPKDWKKDSSGPRLSGALVGDKYLFVAEKLSAKPELYIADVNKLRVTQVDMPGSITKIVFLSETGQILVQLKETKNVILVYFNAMGDPTTIAVK